MNNNIFKKRIIKYIIIFLLSLCIILSYWEIDKCNFVSIDDYQYILNNQHIKNGFTKESVLWAFKSFYAANWHPITWFSHILDYNFYNNKPQGHHLTNLVLHIFNTILLFVFLQIATRNIWKSAFVAALFGLHPLHVESVAWVSERKDLLCTFFMFLALIFYYKYSNKKEHKYYLLSFISFAFGLMSKPMIVTLPVLFLILDFWPLKRFGKKLTKKEISFLFIEKIPFFILSGFSSVITILAQHHGSAIANIIEFPIILRIQNAIISYCLYLWKMVFPKDLCFYYPLFLNQISFLKFILCLIFLIIISFLAIILIKRKPFLFSGWLWYLVSLLPVIGIIQVGSQAMADRYTYIPSIGVFIVFAYFLENLSLKHKFIKYLIVILSIMSIFYLSFLTKNQLKYWKNDLNLSEHALSVTKNNFVALSIKGNVLMELKKYDEALDFFKKSLDIQPAQPSPKLNIGLIYLRKNMPLESLKYFNELIQNDSENTVAFLNAGIAYSKLGDYDSSIKCFLYAIKKDSLFASAYHNLGITYGVIKDYDNCQKYIKKSIQLNPKDVVGYYSLGQCCFYANKINEAISWLKKSLSLYYDFVECHRLLSKAYEKNNNLELSKKHLSIADSIENLNKSSKN